jgi:predicted HTH domain antitoxin
MAAVYSLNKAARILDADRNLVTFLVQDRQIPTVFVGKAKAIDEAGLDRLRRELAAYHAKYTRRVAAGA